MLKFMFIEERDTAFYVIQLTQNDTRLFRTRFDLHAQSLFYVLDFEICSFMQHLPTRIIYFGIGLIPG